MTVINQDIIILLQIIIQNSEIWYLKSIIFSLIYFLINIVIEDKDF